jgi:TPP-dependent pyruvate/acetoin dehydrogenase alpha subunit
VVDAEERLIVTMEAPKLLQHYRRMLLIRRFEERVAELHQQKHILGSVHLCNGQEAIAVGTCAALELDRDRVFPTYRGHGWTLSCGVPVGLLFAELLGREAGLNGGRGGSAYHTAPDYGMYGENSIVGAGAPIACGAALAAQYDSSGRVCVAVLGDGAMNQGAVHEAMNFASIRSLPVVFVIENNRYSELTPIADMVRISRLSARASAYGITGLRIDGNDVETVAATMRQVVAKARAGEGPLVVEAMTERIVGHYIGDAQHYRQPGEVEDAMEREPLVRTRARLIEEGAGEEWLIALEEEVAGEIATASEMALAAPMADASTVRDHLYA